MGKRRRLIALVCALAALALAALALGGLALGGTPYPAASAARAADEPPASAPPSSVQISGGFSFTGADVTGPRGQPARALDAYQAAVFVQSWIGDLYYGKPKRQNPPKQLPVYRVDVRGTWNGDADVATLAVYYASDGKTVWVSFPPQPTATSTPSTRPPAPAGWFVALPRVAEAFAGTAELVPTGGTDTTPVTAGPAAADSGSSGGAAWPWLVLGAAAVAVVGGLVAWVRSRRRAMVDR